MTSIDCRPRWHWLLPTLVSVILFSSAGTIACECYGIITVEIENRTDQKVAVYRDDTRLDVVDPGRSESDSVERFEGTKTFTVKTLDGRTLTSRTFTWEEIRKKGGIKIVVEE